MLATLAALKMIMPLDLIPPKPSPDMRRSAAIQQTEVWAQPQGTFHFQNPCFGLPGAVMGQRPPFLRAFSVIICLQKWPKSAKIQNETVTTDQKVRSSNLFGCATLKQV